MTYIERYEKWLSSDKVDEKTKEELKSISQNDKEIKERFYCNLEFGTAGLRGIIGAGINRMNIYTVRRATQGISEDIKNSGQKEIDAGVVIAYDSRHMSYEFALESAKVLAANGIKAYLFDELRPTPELSFAVRHLGCSRGIVITASHNPKEYNGYKAYGKDGGQLPPSSSDYVISIIDKIDIFNDVRTTDFDSAIDNGTIKIIGKETDEAYYEEVLKLSLCKSVASEEMKKLKVVYTPLHGSGNVPVREVLKRAGKECAIFFEQAMQLHHNVL